MQFLLQDSRIDITSKDATVRRIDRDSVLATACAQVAGGKPEQFALLLMLSASGNNTSVLTKLLCSDAISDVSDEAFQELYSYIKNLNRNVWSWFSEISEPIPMILGPKNCKFHELFENFVLK